MDVSKEFQNRIWPSIKDYLPRGKKTQALDDIKKRIRGAKNSETIKKITWEIIDEYFGPDLIAEENQKIIDKKIENLFKSED